MIQGKGLVPFFCMWISSCPNTILLETALSLIKLSWCLGQKSVDYEYVGLFLDSVLFHWSVCLVSCLVPALNTDTHGAVFLGQGGGVRSDTFETKKACGHADEQWGWFSLVRPSPMVPVTHSCVTTSKLGGLNQWRGFRLQTRNLGRGPWAQLKYWGGVTRRHPRAWVWGLRGRRRSFETSPYDFSMRPLWHRGFSHVGPGLPRGVSQESLLGKSYKQFTALKNQLYRR